jgi:hypothetical protein
VPDISSRYISSSQGTHIKLFKYTIYRPLYSIHVEADILYAIYRPIYCSRWTYTLCKSTHTLYLGLYHCLSHLLYSVNYFPSLTHKHEKLDTWKVRNWLFKCHDLGHSLWPANQKQPISLAGPCGDPCILRKFTVPNISADFHTNLMAVVLQTKCSLQATFVLLVYLLQKYNRKFVPITFN